MNRSRAALLGLMWAAGMHLAARASSELRINDLPGLAHNPGGSDGYGGVIIGSELHLVWLQKKEYALEVQLTRIDLETSQPIETLQLTDGRGLSAKGGRWQTDIAALDGEVHLSWFERSQQGRYPKHFLRFTTLSRHRAGIEPEQFVFGKFIGSPRLLSTSKGLFLVGYSQDLDASPWKLRLYRYTGQNWEEVPQVGRLNGRFPILFSLDGGLGLLWADGQRLVLASSEDGFQWSEGRILHEGVSPLISLSLGQGENGRAAVAWLEPDAGNAVDVWVADIGSGGLGEPKKGLTLESGRVQISLGHLPTGAFIVYSIRFSEARTTTVGIALEGERWQPRILGSQDPYLEVPSVPYVLSGADDTYIAWSQYPMAIGKPQPRSLFLAAFSQGLDQGMVQDIGTRRINAADSAPRLWEYRGRLFVSYFSRKWAMVRGAPGLHGDLYFSEVEGRVEARGH